MQSMRICKSAILLLYNCYSIVITSTIFRILISENSGGKSLTKLELVLVNYVKVTSFHE